MEEEDMNNGGSEAGKTESICHGKECAEIKITLSLIRLQVNMKIGVYYGRDIVVLAGGSEEAIWENGESLGIEDIEPIGNWSNNIHYKPISKSNVGGSEPWASKWTPEVRGYAGPIKSECTDPEACEARTYLLGQYRIGK